MMWTELRVENWSLFTDELDKLGVLPPLEQRLVFRGQSKSEWTLQPKICRGIRQQQTPMRIIELEEAARREFASQAHLHLKPSILPAEEASSLNWWLLMQHHNAPTRLLDWSGSPYVAAYFAVVEHWDCDGAVWCFDHRRVDEYMALEFGDRFENAIEHHIDELLTDPEAQEMLFTITRFKKSDRMVTQQGSSTLCTEVLADHADVIPKAFSAGSNSAACRKFEIPAASKRQFLIHLRSMNITASALFPGIDGFGRSVEELVQLSAWIDT